MNFAPVMALRRFWFASIRRQVMLSFAAVTALMMLLFGYGILEQERAFLRKQSITYAQGLARTVAVSSASWVLANDVVGLQEVIASVGHTPNLRYVLVLSPEGRVLAASEQSSVGKYVSDEQSRRLIGVVAPKPLVVVDSSTMVDVTEPVMIGGKLIGWVRVGFGRDEVAAALRNLERASALMLSVSLALTLLVALMLSAGLTRRLQQLVAAARQVQHGERDVRVAMVGYDELSMLAERFNSMLDALQQADREMVGLNRGLQDAEERWRYALEGAGDGAWDWDVQHGKTMFSKRWKEMVGYGEDEFEDSFEAWLASLHPEDRQRVQDAVQDYFDGKTPEYRIEFRMRCKDGSFKWILARGIVVGRNAEGKPLRMIGTHSDISARKQSEDALRRSNADLERFAYSVSHDMRQPLRAVTGHLQLLQRSLKDKLDDDDRENMNFALEGAKRMDSMILSLLEFSRVGRKTEAMKTMESRESLDEALAFLEPAIRQTNAEIVVVGVWPQVYASRDELTRLFQNLIGNALHYHEPDQPPRVEVSSIMDSVWRVSVRDHGIGIDPQQIDRLFQFFSRLQSRARFDGTGMGLALCRRIVEHHGGRIWAESEGAGKGSTFVFEMPLREAGEDK